MNLDDKLIKHLKAEKIYYQHFWDESHGWFMKWIIVSLIKIYLIYKNNSKIINKILYNLFMWIPLIGALVYLYKIT